jgi:hypothetical protein
MDKIAAARRAPPCADECYYAAFAKHMPFFSFIEYACFSRGFRALIQLRRRYRSVLPPPLTRFSRSKDDDRERGRLIERRNKRHMPSCNITLRASVRKPFFRPVRSFFTNV